MDGDGEVVSRPRQERNDLFLEREEGKMRGERGEIEICIARSFVWW